MTGLQYYCIDLESSGLKAGYHECTEIGIIRATDRVQLWRNIKCEFPSRANIDALAITKKTLADLSQGHSKEKVVEDCNNFFNEDSLTPAHRCIVGHNIYSFDRRFLFALWESVGKTFPATMWLDTIPMTRQYAKQMGIIKPKVNLQAACDLVGVKKLSESHNAKVDSRNSYLLWKKLVEDKKIDHLPFIKTAAHSYLSPEAALATLDEDDLGLDPALLDIE
jgi:DNA polymerase III alpha subunit (gram-positive type)